MDYEAAKAAMDRAVTDNDFNSAAERFDMVSYYRDAAELAKQCRENAKEYLYQQALSAMNAAVTEDDFNNAAKLFDNMSGYCDSKALAKHCSESAEYARKNALYNSYVEAFDTAETEIDYHYVLRGFESISGHRDADEYVVRCKEKAQKASNNFKYSIALDIQNVDGIESQKDAMKRFESLGDFKDSKQRAKECRKRIEELEQEKENARIAAEKAAKKAKHKKIIVAISVVVIVAVLAAIILVPPMVKYNKAVDLFESGSYDEAYVLFEKLGDYKESANYLGRNELIPYHEIGETLPFGDYNWYIISKTDNGATLLCKDVVATMPYNEEDGDIIWEKCSLRKWLNEDFYNTFTDEEKALIAKTKCENKDNAAYGTEGGNDTEDYIFLLSLDEAKAVDESIRNVGTWWWLRSPGLSRDMAVSRDMAAGVNMYGLFADNGNLVYLNYGVRPALTIGSSETTE